METGFDTMREVLQSVAEPTADSSRQIFRAVHENTNNWPARVTVRERIAFSRIAPLYFVDSAMYERLHRQPGGCLVRLEDAEWREKLEHSGFLREANLKNSATQIPGLNRDHSADARVTGRRGKKKGPSKRTVKGIISISKGPLLADKMKCSPHIYVPKIGSKDISDHPRQLAVWARRMRDTTNGLKTLPRWCVNDIGAEQLGRALAADASDRARAHAAVVVLLDDTLLEPGEELLRSIAEKMPWVSNMEYPVVVLYVLSESWRERLCGKTLTDRDNDFACECFAEKVAKVGRRFAGVAPSLARSFVFSFIEPDSTSLNCSHHRTGEPAEILQAQTARCNGTLSFDHETRVEHYLTFKLHRHPLVASFDFVLRIDDGSSLLTSTVLTRDIFEVLKQHGAVTAPLAGGWEAPARGRSLDFMQAAVSVYTQKKLSTHLDSQVLESWFGRSCIRGRDTDWPACSPSPQAPPAPGRQERLLLVGWVRFPSCALFHALY